MIAGVEMVFNYSYSFSIKRIISILLRVFIISVVLFQFINCSGTDSGSSITQSSNAEPDQNSSSTGGNQPPTNSPAPAPSLNPYILQCINTSDASAVGASLNSALVEYAAQGAFQKIAGFDWQQDEDLAVTVDNNCAIESKFVDQIFNFVDQREVIANQKYTTYVVKKENVKKLALFILAVRESECVAAADKNSKVSLNADVVDPLFSNLKHLSNIGATDAELTALMAYNNGNLYTTKVGVIDSGVDTNNPDLTNNIAKSATGQVIGLNSTSSGESTVLDSGFHGTHVTGLIGAEFKNGIGVTGVYGRNIKIYPVRASNDGSSMTLAAVANGIIWAADQGVDLMNLSLGTTSDSSVLKNAISYAISKNVFIVVAAGNDGKQLTLSSPAYPAMYNAQFAGLVTVGSIDATTTNKSSFSNYSSTYVDIMSPGSNGSTGIYSTVPVSMTSSGSGVGSRLSSSSGNLVPIQGTSMAAPVVTGAMAAVISMSKGKGIDFKNSDLETFLKGSGSPKSQNYASYAKDGSYLNLPTLISFMKTKIDSMGPPPQVLSFTLHPASKQIVKGESVQLTSDVVSNVNPVTYQWYFNNAAIAGANTKNLSLQQVNESAGGVYSVSASAGGKIIYSQNAELKVALKLCN